MMTENRKTPAEKQAKFDELVKQLAEDMPNATIREWMQELELRLDPEDALHEMLLLYTRGIEQVLKDMPNATWRELSRELERRNKWRRVAVS
jgi:hypothetical protein